MKLTLILNTILLWVVALYLLLNYGFMQVRIPPTGGAGVPIGELVLLLTLISINYAQLLPKLFGLVFVYPFLVWWGLGIGRAFMGVPEYGMWALRDATHVLESLFLIAGFAFAADPKWIDRFFRWLPKILFVAVIYQATYPFSDVLVSFSPKISAGFGDSVPILFNYINTSVLLLMAAVYILIFQKEIGISVIRHQPLLFATGLLGYTAALNQARTIYLQIIAIIILFTLYRPKLVSKGILTIVLLLGVVALLPVLGLQIKGRLGEEVSISFFINHFLAIVGLSTKTTGEGVAAASSGFYQRIDWWISIYHRLTSDIWHLLYGLGYGMPLTNFYYSNGALVREPHNSYISILGRIGLIGGIAWVWMHGLLLSVWYSGYRHCTRIGWRQGENRLLILMVYFVLMWVYAFGQDAFEKPYNTIPYYFFWGIVLRYVIYLKNRKISNEID